VKKLNPDQVFVIQSVTRAEVADTMNGVIQNQAWKIPEFTPDDPRLTDEVCEAIAGGSFEAICETDDVVDKEYEYHLEVVREFLDAKPKQKG
jgi:hypothetical protein